MRIPEEVFEDHLNRRFGSNSFDDLLFNYSDDVITISQNGFL